MNAKMRIPQFRQEASHVGTHFHSSAKVALLISSEAYDQMFCTHCVSYRYSFTGYLYHISEKDGGGPVRVNAYRNGKYLNSCDLDLLVSPEPTSVSMAPELFMHGRVG